MYFFKDVTTTTTTQSIAFDSHHLKLQFSNKIHTDKTEQFNNLLKSDPLLVADAAASIVSRLGESQFFNTKFVNSGLEFCTQILAHIG